MQRITFRWAAVLALSLAFLMAALGCGADKSASSGSASQGTQAAAVQPADRETRPADRDPGPVRKTGEETNHTSAHDKYTKEDIEGLRNTENFARGALEHIFDGTINKKGKATGYHYSMVEGSKGHIIDGTRSNLDENEVFTAKVEVGDVKKNGFSSFYPESWTPQEVVDAINEAYQDAVNNPQNPQGDLWIGYHGNLEIDMYLNDKKKIVTAYPIYVGKKK